MRKGTVKKIVALGTGLTMLGATIFGASAAADLSQYPNPLFITDGKFVGNIVVGKAASTEDVLGAIELSAALQTAAVKQVAVPGMSAVYSVDKEAVQIKRTGREMASFDSIRDVFGASISESKLPTLLKDGVFEDNEGENKEDVDYTQTLDFVDNTPTENVIFEFKAADGVFDDAAGHYVWIDDAENVYEYILEFDTPVDFEDSEDLENNVIEIQGNKYTITRATVDGGDLLQKIELLAGETKVWMTQGEPITRTLSGTEHTVILTDVDEDGERCGISVDGTVQWVDKGSVETINGIEIGVTDAIPVHSAGKDTDVCEVNVGATKILLEDGAEVKVNDVTLDDSEVDLYNDDANEWGGFALTYQVDDEIYLKPNAGEDSEWVDPVLGNWMINFANVARMDETFEWKRTGSDDIKFVFQNIDDKKVEINYHYEDGTGWTSGKDCDEPMLEDGDDVTYAAETDLEGVRLLFVAPGDEIHLLEISDVDVTNDLIDIKDLTYGKTYNDLDFEWGNGAQAIQLTGTGTLTLDDDGTTLVATDLIDGASNQFTKYEHEVYFESWYDGTISYALDCTGIGSGDIDVRVVENDISLEDGNTNDVYWDIEATWDGADDEIDFADPDCNDGAATCTDVFQESDTKDQVSMQSSTLGTIAKWDDDDASGGTLMLPEDQVTAQLFITKVGAVVSSSGAGAVQFQQIQVGTAKLDSDISDVTAQNLIAVGGPCANSVASRLMGSPADCVEGFQEGEAMIKLFEQTNGNVALLVAGYSAMDTRRAAKVLANYKDYATSLKGKEVKVKGTTLSDVKVEAVV